MRIIIILMFLVSSAYGQSGYNPIGKTLAKDTVLLERQLKMTGQSGAVIGGYDKAASSILDLQSTSRGLLIPRMSAAQMSAISSPATGLLIYNTSVDAFHFWNGGAWTMISGGITSAGNGITASSGTVKLGGFITQSTNFYFDPTQYLLLWGDTTFSTYYLGFGMVAGKVRLNAVAQRVGLTSTESTNFISGTSTGITATTDATITAGGTANITATGNTNITSGATTTITGKTAYVNSDTANHINARSGDTTEAYESFLQDRYGLDGNSPGVSLVRQLDRKWQFGYAHFQSGSLMSSNLFWGTLNNSNIISDRLRIQLSIDTASGELKAHGRLMKWYKDPTSQYNGWDVSRSWSQLEVNKINEDGQATGATWTLDTSNTATWYVSGNALVMLNSTGGVRFCNKDSATIYALTPAIGDTYYCTDCTPGDNSTGGVLLTHNGVGWRRHW